MNKSPRVRLILNRASGFTIFRVASAIIALALTFFLATNRRETFAQQQSFSSRWTITNSPEFRSGTMTRLHNGKVIAVGVKSSADLEPGIVEIYDPITNTWRETTPLNHPRADHRAILLFDGRLLIVGGTQKETGSIPGTPAGPPEVFDPVTEKWTVIPLTSTFSELPNIWLRSNVSYLPNGKILVLSQIFNRAYLFDPATGIVTQVESPRTNIGGTFPTSRVLHNGKVLFLSGENSNVLSAEIYNPESNSWVTVDLPSLGGYPLPGRLAVTLQNGNVMGLFSTPNNRKVSVIFDPLTQNWSNFTLRNTNYANTQLLPSGEVLSFERNIAEIYSDNSKVWRTVNAPTQSGLGSLLLANGQIFTGKEIYAVDFGSDVAPTVVNTSSASYRVSALARDSLATAFGVNLGETASISIKDSYGFEHIVSNIFSVTPNQINYLVPGYVSMGQAEITFKTNDGQIQRSLISIANTSPGIFTANADGRGVPAATILRANLDGTQVYEPVAKFETAAGRFVPVEIPVAGPAGDAYLVLFGTGWKNLSSNRNVVVYIGGVPAEVQYAGAQGGFAGLDQMNILIPRTLAGRGEVDVLVTIDGETANPVRIKIK